MIQRWWVDKYTLPPNHELYQQRAPADLVREFYTDLFARRDELKEMAKTLPTKERAETQKQIDALEEVLGIKLAADGPMVTGDPWIDRMERELFEGRVPDLES